MSDNPRQTVIEEGTEFDGKMKSQCAITLSGKLTGELSAPSLTVTPAGKVDGKVKVAKLKSQGQVSGKIDAESVELAGSVNDRTVIRATNLEVKLSQPGGPMEVTFGNCELKVGQNAAKGGTEQGGEARHKQQHEQRKPESNQRQDPNKKPELVRS